VLVKTAVSAVSVGTGVKGHISFVKRSSTYKQVLYNGLPIYRYSVDTAAGQAHGQGKVGPGGKWLLIHAAATTTAATPFNLPPTLQSVNPTGYTHILGNSGGRSMYVLSVESGGVLSCINTCPSIWPPLLVATSVTSIRVGTGVAGTIGFVTRSSTTKQVTFKGYPVYTYIGDAGAGTTTGQGIVADGGTWYLANAAATTNGTTQVTTPATTTTTASPYPGY
jgi:predicted lipoprotein with Yx(FWY)xxD motif